jgi:hypothetical protein
MSQVSIKFIRKLPTAALFRRISKLSRDGYDNGAFTMMKETLLCLVAISFMPPVFAEVYKWKDTNGRTHYGDTSPSADAITDRTGKQTDGLIAKSDNIRAESQHSTRQRTLNKTGSANSSIYRARNKH